MCAEPAAAYWISQNSVPLGTASPLHTSNRVMNQLVNHPNPRWAIARRCNWQFDYSGCTFKRWCGLPRA